MSNNQRKKALAARHNARYIEEQAYAEDRIRDPEKYRRKNRRGVPSAVVASAIVRVSLATIEGR